MRKKAVPVGIEDFKELIQEGMNEKYMDILKEYLKKNKRKYHIAFK